MSHLVDRPARIGLLFGLVLASAQSLTQYAVADSLARNTWLQIASRQSSDEAITIAKQYSGAKVVASRNGWYAVILGPFPFSTLSDVQASYHGETSLPDDAYLTDGNYYTTTVWNGG